MKTDRNTLQLGFRRAVSAIALTSALVLSGCQTTPPETPTDPNEIVDGPPAVPMDPTTIQPAIPKNEPRSRYGNHSPYTVLNKEYEVLETSENYAEEGIASWYGTKFHGRRTSSWEPYDMYSMTAAHRALPLPTYVRVTNLDNRKTTIVRVNDRGPFHSDRIIDLSYAAAVKLDFVEEGTARVKVEVIEPTPPKTFADANTKLENKAVNEIKENLFIQVGAYSDLARAEQIRTDLKEWVTFPVNIGTLETEGGALYRVQIGPLRNALQAKTINQLLSKEFNIEAPMLVWN